MSSHHSHRATEYRKLKVTPKAIQPSKTQAKKKSNIVSNAAGYINSASITSFQDNRTHPQKLPAEQYATAVASSISTLGAEISPEIQASITSQHVDYYWIATEGLVDYGSTWSLQQSHSSEAQRDSDLELVKVDRMDGSGETEEGLMGIGSQFIGVYRKAELESGDALKF
ncbi:hypothetical protein VTL71DRAFT_15154 [Oculimacula yallundae]|uniref:Uncharacterized protein n=1 Tax=Oculimacula yallundae TaxID=86028 RepID=A0ABR4CFR5_9HELO